jgi:hypothetical protein
MRQRLLVGLGAATLTLLTVLSVALAAGRGQIADHPSPSPTLVAPSSGACLAGSQQCNPVAPQQTSAATPGVALLAAVVTVVTACVGLTLLRRRRRASRLPAGTAVTLLHPPRTGLRAV